MSSIIGVSLPRLGAIERVIGAQQYTADIRLDNALHVKLVSLPCAHARIVAVRTDEAVRVPGVRGIFTARDLPQPVPRYGPIHADRPMLAATETKYSGEPVAVVVADTEDAARRAATLVRVDVEELPAVLSVETSLDARHRWCRIRLSARTIRSRTPIRCNSGSSDGGRRPGGRRSRHRERLRVSDGHALRHRAARVSRRRRRERRHGLEPHPASVRPAACRRGRPQWPIARVRIIAPDPGGGFGGKGWPKVEPLMAWLALKHRAAGAARADARRNVSGRTSHVCPHPRANRLRQRRTHHFSGHPGRFPARRVRRHRHAGRQQGQLFGMRTVPAAHARISARALLSHTPPSTAFRGFGTPQASWAVESQLNEAASALGIDPVEIRRRNLPAKGEAFNPNDTPADGEWSVALAKGAAAIGWNAPLASNRGRGISLGLKSSSTASRSVAIVRLHFDGSASVLCGTSDMGQGARTVMMQIAAQELGPDTRSYRDCHGRHVARAVRLVHVCEPIDGVHGQRGDQRVRQREEAVAEDG